MRKLDREILLFISLIIIANTILLLLGDDSPDIFLAVTILIYYVSTNIGEEMRRASYLRVLDIIFVIVFAAIVGYRLISLIEGT